MSTKKVKFISRYDYDSHLKNGFKTTQPSMTKQSFKDECDINKIVARAERTGILTDPFTRTTRVAKFGDFTNASSYQEMLNKVLDAQAEFDRLNPAVRDRFDNDPEKLLRFLEDENNREEAEKLGLVNKRPPQVTQAPTTPIPEAPPPKP